MKNYEYIIASLPVIQQDDRSAANLDVDNLHEQILEQLDGGDREDFLLLLDGFRPDRLDGDFYRKALASRNGFMREYFLYDLNVRNTKVEYLNHALARPEGQDMLLLDEDDENVFEGKEQVQAVLEQNDILSRERGLDDLMWAKCEELTTMHVFDLDVILAFAARLQIIDRWLRLDPETGRELFRKLVNEIRNNR